MTDRHPTPAFWLTVALVAVLVVAVDFLYPFNPRTIDKRFKMALGIAFGISGAVGMIEWLLNRRRSGQ